MCYNEQKLKFWLFTSSSRISTNSSTKIQNSNRSTGSRSWAKSKGKHQWPKFKIQNIQIRRNISINWSVCFGNWFFGFGYYLEFSYWDLNFNSVTGKDNRFYLNQLEMGLTLPWFRLLSCWHDKESSLYGILEYRIIPNL